MNKMKRARTLLKKIRSLALDTHLCTKTDLLVNGQIIVEGYYHQFYVSPLIPIVMDEILLENVRFSWSLESIMINRTYTKLYILNDSTF